MRRLRANTHAECDLSLWQASHGCTTVTLALRSYLQSLSRAAMSLDSASAYSIPTWWLYFSLTLSERSFSMYQYNDSKNICTKDEVSGFSIGEV